MLLCVASWQEHSVSNDAGSMLFSIYCLSHTIKTRIQITSIKAKYCDKQILDYLIENHLEKQN